MSFFLKVVRLYNKETLLNQSIMKEMQSTFKEHDVLEKKIQRLQRQISSRYWFGWAGNSPSSEKK